MRYLTHALTRIQTHSLHVYLYRLLLVVTRDFIETASSYLTRVLTKVDQKVLSLTLKGQFYNYNFCIHIKV